jgi:hypothetical protein
MTKYDNLVNKHVVVENKLMTLKKTSESRRHADKESIASLEEKKRDHNQKRLEVERLKNRLANLTIEEEKSLRAQYKMQANNEREARKADESDIGEY